MGTLKGTPRLGEDITLQQMLKDGEHSGALYNPQVFSYFVVGRLTIWK